MPTLTGRNSDLVIELTSLFKMCGILFLHPYRAAATTDVAGQAQQLLYRNHLYAFVSGSFCSFFQIQLTADRDAKHMNAGAFATSNQGFVYLLRRKSNCNSCVIAVQIVFIKFVKFLTAGDTGRLDKSYCICF